MTSVTGQPWRPGDDVSVHEAHAGKIQRRECIGCKNTPSVYAQVKSAAKATARHIASGRKNVDSETLKKRQAICKSCEELFFDDRFKQERCRCCGCFMLVKARWQTSKCILGKW